MSMLRYRRSQVRIRRRDVEALLSGGTLRGKGFDNLAAAIAVIRAPIEVSRSEIVAGALVGRAAATARSRILLEVSPRAVTVRTRPPVMRPAWSLAVGVFALMMMFGSISVAVAADRSAPGDLLYGLDRALERVGFGAGGVVERVVEAGLLVDRGRAAEAVTHLSDSIAEMAGGADRYSATLVLAQLEGASARLGSNMAAEVAALKGTLLALLDDGVEGATTPSGSDGPHGHGPGTSNGQGNTHGPDGNSSSNSQGWRSKKVKGPGMGIGHGNAHVPAGTGSGKGPGPGSKPSKGPKANPGPANAQVPDVASAAGGLGSVTNSGQAFGLLKQGSSD